MAGKTSQGTIIGISELPAVAYTPIECTVGINMEDAEAATIDVTCLSSTAKEKILGLQDNGNLTLDLNVNFADAGYILLKDARASGAAYGFQIELATEGTETTGRTFTFEGLVKSLPFAMAVDAAITGNATIEITGDVVEAEPIT